MANDELSLRLIDSEFSDSRHNSVNNGYDGNLSGAQPSGKHHLRTWKIFFSIVCVMENSKSASHG